ncbi:MAG: hypothetical protein LBT12_08085 [Oscillospiraceae bacterium]|jgi:hypothetical protein|nr:hypothetical protein [Oscillospiraceae bacterium]
MTDQAVIPTAALLTGGEGDAKLFYLNREEDSACIGYMRGDFGRNGCEFWHTWTDGDPRWNRRGKRTPRPASFPY